MKAAKVLALRLGFILGFLAVFAVMFALLSVAVFVFPAGLMICVLGFAVKLFNAQFIVTSLSPELMLFGGLAASFGAAFFGLAAVKAGLAVSRLYVRVRRKCDLLLGWKPL